MPTAKLKQEFRMNLLEHSKEKFNEHGASLHRSSNPELGPLYLKLFGRIHRTGVTMTELAQYAGVDLSSIPAGWLD